MAYLRIVVRRVPPGGGGCGSTCPCGPCRGASPLGEWYVRDDDEPERPRAQPPPGRPAASAAPSEPGRTGEPAPRRVGPPILDRFAHGSDRLVATHGPVIGRLARLIAGRVAAGRPIGTIRLVGHTDGTGPEALNVELGRRRALAVQRALARALDRLRPGLSQQITVAVESLGETRPRADNRSPVGRARNRRVEVFLSAAAAAPPTPAGPSPGAVSPDVPPRRVRIPSPAEAARMVEPLRPETAEERVERILTTPTPSRPPRPPLDQLLWRRVDERLGAAMNRLRVPARLRRPIRDAAHAALTSGAESVLGEALDRLGLTGETKEAIQASVRGALRTRLP